MDSPIQIRPNSTGSCGPMSQIASDNMKTASNAEDARSMPSLITTGDYAATASHGIFWKPYLSTSLVRHTSRKVGDHTDLAKMPTSIVTAKESRAPELPDQGPRSSRDPTEPFQPLPLPRRNEYSSRIELLHQLPANTRSGAYRFSPRRVSNATSSPWLSMAASSSASVVGGASDSVRPLTMRWI